MDTFQSAEETRMIDRRRRLVFFFVLGLMLFMLGGSALAYVVMQGGRGPTDSPVAGNDDNHEYEAGNNDAGESGEKPDSTGQGSNATVRVADKKDSSVGRKGMVQTFDVLASHAPTPGETFVLSSFRLALVQNPIQGSSLSADEKTVTAPGEGTYGVDGSSIRYTPAVSFAGTARGVSYAIEDTAGVTFKNTYSPVVQPVDTPAAPTPPVTTPAPVVATCADPASQNRILPNMGITLNGEYVSELNRLYPSGYSLSTSGDLTRMFSTDFGGNILRSRDAGSTWDVLEPQEGTYMSSVVTANDGQFVYAVGEDDYTTSSQKAYRSVNGGDTWTGLGDIEISGDLSISADGSTLVGYTYGEVIMNPVLQFVRSTDQGTSWQAFDFPGVSPGKFKVSADGSVISTFAYDQSYENYGVYRSEDGGETWTVMSVDIEVTPTGQLAMSGDGSVLVIQAYDYAVSSGSLFRSIDSGESWQELPTPAGYQPDRFDVSPDGSSILLSGYDDDYLFGLFESSDGGGTWSPELSETSGGYPFIARTGTSRLYFAEDGLFVNAGGGDWILKAPARQDYDITKIDLDANSPGQQTIIDRATTEGWRATYETGTGVLRLSIIDQDLYYAQDGLTDIEYTVVPAANCTAPSSARIGISPGDN